VYFVTQNPLDIPETVLGQLGNRVQHALRAYTPRDQKAVRTAAQTLRQNPSIDTEKVITELGVGEALVSFLDEKGAPTMVERAFVLPPGTRIGPLTPEERTTVREGSILKGAYETTVDRESAYEKLKARVGTTGTTDTTGTTGTTRTTGTGGSSVSDLLFGSTGPRGGHREGMLESAAKSAARSMGSGLGRSILRGMLGSILGGKR
jgi:DNA helicase HerA-like ATPase